MFFLMSVKEFLSGQGAVWAEGTLDAAFKC